VENLIIRIRPDIVIHMDSENHFQKPYQFTVILSSNILNMRMLHPRVEAGACFVHGVVLLMICDMVKIYKNSLSNIIKEHGQKLSKHMFNNRQKAWSPIIKQHGQ
jgi:hypothetical protein